MTVSGHVVNGQIILDESIPLAEGMRVRVEFLNDEDKERKAQNEPTLYDQLKPIIGVIKDWPPDFARNHDHYIHGQPKK
jgi:hypothetical protein